MFKKFKILLISLLLSFSPCCAVVDDFDEKKNPLDNKTNEKNETIFDKIITLDETIDGDSIKGVVYEDDPFEKDFKLFAEKTFADKKTINFRDTFIDELSGELRFQGVWGLDKIGDNPSSTYPFDINGVIESKFGKNKYRFFTEYAFTRNTSDMDNEFFGKFSNLYIERNFNDNHKMRIGTSRSPIGLEGSMSSFSLPFANRAQISRNFGDAISTGVSFIGKQKGFEYNLGGYTSTRFSQGFKDGAEFIGRVGYAPFYNKNNALKNLKIYAGADVGHRSDTYGVYSTALTYEYKKFLMNFEYAYADGSNGDYFNPSSQQGFFTTLGWNFTPKWQMLFRYDYFDPNTSVGSDIKTEYSVGLNYFIFEQRLKFAINYVFKNNQYNDSNSNAIYFLTQFFI